MSDVDVVINAKLEGQATFEEAKAGVAQIKDAIERYRSANSMSKHDEYRVLCAEIRRMEALRSQLHEQAEEVQIALWASEFDRSSGLYAKQSDLSAEILGAIAEEQRAEYPRTD